eukprot:scaffold14533_cov118-Isochrysis_galbana.AAC.6
MIIWSGSLIWCTSDACVTLAARPAAPAPPASWPTLPLLATRMAFLHPAPPSSAFVFVRKAWSMMSVTEAA